MLELDVNHYLLYLSDFSNQYYWVAFQVFWVTASFLCFTNHSDIYKGALGLQNHLVQLSTGLHLRKKFQSIFAKSNRSQKSLNS